MPAISRGFHGRRGNEADAGRVPQGQYVTRDFPVLSAGPTPHTPIESWSFELRGAIDEVRSWTWAEFTALPSERITVDIHCVSKWSKLDTSWTGVSLDTLLDGVETNAAHILAFSDGGYSANLPLADVSDGKAGVAYEFEDEPLAPEHGGPARLLVPRHYFWTSAKWLSGIELRPDDEPGFWERYGYHNYGDPWKEERTRATDLAAGPRGRARPGERPHHEPCARPARPARPPRGPARGRAAHGRRRLPGPAQLLDRLGARRRPRDPHRRAPPGRRVSPYLTETLQPGTISSCAARS